MFSSRIPEAGLLIQGQPSLYRATQSEPVPTSPFGKREYKIKHEFLKQQIKEYPQQDKVNTLLKV